MARLRRKSREQPVADNESVDLDTADHAWWAKSQVNHAFSASGPEDDQAEPETSSAFFDEWSTASLYGTGPESSAGPETPPPLFAADEAYLVFGLTENATWEEVVTAHRRLAKRYHPDRLIGASPEAQHRGEERMRELNVAYESLRRVLHPPTRSLFTP